MSDKIQNTPITEHAKTSYKITSDVFYASFCSAQFVCLRRSNHEVTRDIRLVLRGFKINSFCSASSLLSSIISWQACEDSSGGFTVMNLHGTTQNKSRKGTSADVIVFNLIRSNWKEQTKELSAIHRPR